MRITPAKIKEFQENEIFVFGSNQAGRHGKGSALLAMSLGAKYGQAEGLQGKTYAIPTKDYYVRGALDIDIIKVYVNRFINFAKCNPHLKFFVTEIGCGLAGYKPDQISALFEGAKSLENVYLPESFWKGLE